MILIACDSFKDSLSAKEVCEAIKRGFQLAKAQEEIVVFPLADGGEGTAEILTYHSNGREVNLEVTDPLFQKIEVNFGLAKNGKTAFIEMAEAAGIQLLSPSKRNPLKTTTYGVGEMILKAVEKGAQKILLGIGGSATNDCGIGMANALGYKFLDRKGRELKPTGENLEKVFAIDDSGLKFDRDKIWVEVICDVDNPLFGKNGAAFIYGKQKGASEMEIERLDDGLRHFSKILTEHFDKDFSELEGGGAAGGLGVGSVAFLKADLKSGIELVMKYSNFEEQLKNARLVITGEGKIDNQTLNGKLIKGVTTKAAKYQIPVIAFCGTLKASPQEIENIGLLSAFSILNQPCDLEFALKNTGGALENLAYNIYKLIDPFNNSKSVKNEI